MKGLYPGELEEGLHAVRTAQMPLPEHLGAAVIVGDALSRRLIEAATVQIGLEASVFENVPSIEAVAGFELIIADEAEAEMVRDALAARDGRREDLHPAIVAVRPATLFAGKATWRFSAMSRLPTAVTLSPRPSRRRASTGC